MRKAIIVAAAGLAGVAASASADQVFGNLANFQSAVPNAVLNTFDTVPNGSVGSLSYDFGAFAYDITAAGTGSNILFNNNGVVSTSNVADSLVITFTRGDVRAFGGDWWGTDLDFNDIAARITITLDDGTEREFNTNGPRFGGYLSDTTISSITISAAVNGDVAGAWPTMDNFRVAVVPLPPAAWAGLATLGLAGGVRAWRRRG